MNLLLCYRRTTSQWMSAVRDLLRDFVDEIFVDAEAHLAGEPWRPRWREALDRDPSHPATVLVFLGSAMAKPGIVDDVCHMEIQEAIQSGARVVFLQAQVPGRDLFEELVTAYRQSGRPGVGRLEGARGEHREVVPASVDDFATASDADKKATRLAAWKAVFDKQVRVFETARQRARAWSEQVCADRLSDTGDLQSLGSEFLSGSSGTRSGIGSQALVGPSGTGKSRLLARWILCATAPERLAPYVVMVAAEEVVGGVRALCRMLGIERAPDRLSEMGFASVPDVLVAFFELLSANDQQRGLVVVVDSLERAVDVVGATAFLQALQRLRHVAVWLTCRRSAWGRYEAAVDIPVRPVAEVQVATVAQVLGVNVDAPSGRKAVPPFVCRAVNLDIFCFLRSHDVMREVPVTEAELLDRYLDFAVIPPAGGHGVTDEDVRQYLRALATRQVEDGSIRVKAEDVERNGRDSTSIRPHLIDRARILRVDQDGGQPMLRLRHDRLDGHNLATWCSRRFDERLPRLIGTASKAIGLLALGGLYRLLIDRSEASRRRRLFEEFVWILDRKPFGGRSATRVDAEKKAAFNAAAWTVSYVLLEDHERALPDIRDALRGPRAKSLAATDCGVVEHVSVFPGTGNGSVSLDAAVSIASVIRPGRGLPAIDVSGTDTVQVFAGWIFEKAPEQRFRFVEAVSRFDDEHNSSIAVFAKLFTDGLGTDVDLVKSLAASVAARSDAEAQNLKEQLLALVRNEEFLTSKKDPDRRSFLRWVVESEIEGQSEPSEAVARGALRLTDPKDRKSDWVDVEAGLRVLRELAEEPPCTFGDDVVTAVLTMLGHEHQSVRESSLRVLPLLFSSLRVRAALLSLVAAVQFGQRWIARVDAVLREAASSAAAGPPGVLAAMLAEIGLDPAFKAARSRLESGLSALQSRFGREVTANAVEARRFDDLTDSPRLDVSHEPFAVDERAATLVKRHATADPGPETEAKYRLLAVALDHFEIGRSSWEDARRFFAAVASERAAIAAGLAATPPERTSEWLALVDRRAVLLGIGEDLAAVTARSPALLSLHVVVRTRRLTEAASPADGEPWLVLAVRAPTAAFSPGATAVSFEEQFTTADIPADCMVSTWIANCACRGFIEEFGLEGVGEVVAQLPALAAATRLRSLVLESALLNVALVATVELPWTRPEFERLLANRTAVQAAGGAAELRSIGFCRLTAQDLKDLQARVEGVDAAGFHPTTALRLRIARRAWFAG